MTDATLCGLINLVFEHNSCPRKISTAIIMLFQRVYTFYIVLTKRTVWAYNQHCCQLLNFIFQIYEKYQEL